MPGLPPWLFFGVALLILVVSLVLVAAQGRAGPAPGRRWRFDLLGSRAPRALVKHRGFPLAVQLPVVGLFLLVVTAGLFGSPSPERRADPHQVTLVLVGHVCAIVIAHPTARALEPADAHPHGL